MYADFQAQARIKCFNLRLHAPNRPCSNLKASAQQPPRALAKYNRYTSVPPGFSSRRHHIRAELNFQTLHQQECSESMSPFSYDGHGCYLATCSLPTSAKGGRVPACGSVPSDGTRLLALGETHQGISQRCTMHAQQILYSVARAPNLHIYPVKIGWPQGWADMNWPERV